MALLPMLDRALTSANWPSPPGKDAIKESRYEVEARAVHSVGAIPLTPSSTRAAGPAFIHRSVLLPKADIPLSAPLFEKAVIPK